jgi:hypothetical protein
MAKHRNSPHMAFWRMLKQGNDHFEVSRREPKVEVCDKHYVFDAETNGKFSPAGACPPYQVSQELASAVAEKQKRDERQMAEYISKGTPTVPVVTRTDGGMHPAFQAAFQKPYTEVSGVIRTPGVSTPGTIPAHAVPPRAPEGGATGSTGSAVVASAGDSGSSGNLFGGLFASNNTEPSNSEGVLDRMSRFVGWKASDPAPTQPAPAQTKKSQPTKTAATTPKAPAPKATAAATTNAGAIRAAAPKAATPEAKPEQKPESPPEAKATAAAEPRPSSSAGLLNGAQPTVPTGSFSNRWGSF